MQMLTLLIVIFLPLMGRRTTQEHTTKPEVAPDEPNVESRGPLTSS